MALQVTLCLAEPKIPSCRAGSCGLGKERALLPKLGCQRRLPGVLPRWCFTVEEDGPFSYKSLQPGLR